MTSLQKHAQQEVRNNYIIFAKELPHLLEQHRGEFLLLHQKEFIAYFQTLEQAFEAGMEKYGKGNFSIQEVTDRIELFGYGLV